MDVVQYLEDAEAFHRAVTAERYQAGAGIKPTLEIAPIYQQYIHLVEGERFNEIPSWDLDPTQVRYLQKFVADGYLANQTTDLAQQIAGAEVAATIEWDGGIVPYRNVPVLIANEPDAVRRHALEELHLAALVPMNELYDDREKLLQRGARGFRYPDYVALYDDLGGFQLDDLTEKMRAFILATDDLYFSALDTYLRDMRILRDDARRCDLARIFRAPELDTWFPSDRAMAALHATLKEMGIRLEDQENIRVDTAERPLKSPRAFCAAIRVPEDVRLVVKPTGGLPDYEALFHEAGHAEHFANVDRTLPFAFRRLGDDSVTESYAFLLQHLTSDPYWLDRHLNFGHASSYLALSGFHRLYFLRRYGTKLIYEQELHRADEPGDVAPLYDELLSRNLGVTYGPETYLSDVDGGFYAAAYLRAWVGEAQMRRFLQREYDLEWFRNPKAGRFLVELWRDGQKHPADAIARFMGYDGLDPQFVIDDVRALMGAN